MHTIYSTVQPAFFPAVLKAITAAVAATDCPTDETACIASKRPAQYPTHTTTDGTTSIEADGAAQ